MRNIVILMLFAYNCLAQLQNTEYTYQGNINGKIPVKFNISFDGNIIDGTLIYTRVGQPIKIIGTLDGENITLYEFYTKDQVSGGFRAKRTQEGFAGNWFSTKPNTNEMKFSIRRTADRTFTTKNFSVTGTYSYNLGNNKGVGDLFVQETADNKLIISALVVGAAPSHNQAILDKVTFLKIGNEAFYESTESGKCKIKISFSENGASVLNLDNATDCGFGNNATVVGNYRKMNANSPNFPKFE